MGREHGYQPHLPGFDDLTLTAARRRREDLDAQASRNESALLRLGEEQAQQRVRGIYERQIVEPQQAIWQETASLLQMESPAVAVDSQLTQSGWYKYVGLLTWQLKRLIADEGAILTATASMQVDLAEGDQLPNSLSGRQKRALPWLARACMALRQLPPLQGTADELAGLQMVTLPGGQRQARRELERQLVQHVFDLPDRQLTVDLKQTIFGIERPWLDTLVVSNSSLNDGKADRVLNVGHDFESLIDPAYLPHLLHNVKRGYYAGTPTIPPVANPTPHDVEAYLLKRMPKGIDDNFSKLASLNAHLLP